MSLPPPACALLIGLSHVVAIRVAQDKRVARGATKFDLITTQLFPKYDPLWKLTDGRRVLHEDIEPDLKRTVEEAAPQCVLGAFWSDQHFFLSTANSPRRFDFVLPFEPDLPLDTAAEIVPYDAMFEWLRRHCALIELLIASTQRAASAPLFLLPAPPPIEDLSAIAAGSASARIDAMVEEHGAAPGWLRYKFWRLMDVIYAEMAAKAHVAVLPPPSGTRDERGFRRQEYFGPDYLHANTAYGDLVLNQCEGLLRQG